MKLDGVIVVNNELPMSFLGLLSMPTFFDHSAGQQMFVVGRNGFLSEQVHTSTDCLDVPCL